MTVADSLGFSGVGALEFGVEGRTSTDGLFFKCFCQAGGGVDGTSVGCSSFETALVDPRPPPPNSAELSKDALTHPHFADVVTADVEEDMEVSSKD